MVLWGYSPLIYLKLALKKQFKNLQMQIHQASCLKMIQMMKQISLLGLCLHTKRAHCLHPSIFTALLSSILICRRTQLWHASLQHVITLCWLCRIVNSDYAINTISSCVLIFHCHHQSLHWRRFLPKSTLYGWLWGYGIWCYTIDSRFGSKFIYNKDQHANTYVSAWGSFPAKYGHHILPSNLDLTSHYKAGLHETFWNSLIKFLCTDLDGNRLPSNLDLTIHNKAGLHQEFWKSLVEFFCIYFLIEFLCTDLDENLSFTLNPLTTSKLDHFLSTLFEGLSETTNKGKMLINMCGMKKASIASLMR